MIRRLGPDEVEVLKALRFAALADAPSAFGTTLAQAQGYSDEMYRDRLHPAANPTFIWEDDAGAHGMAIAARPDVGQDESIGHLFGMWVRPSVRGSGAADALVRAVLDWLRAEGFAAAQLHVTEGNEAAERLYRRHGFVATGVCEVRARDGMNEVEMIRPLDH